jgi:hypothetical protein
MKESTEKFTYDMGKERDDFINNFKTKLNEFMYDKVPHKLTMAEFEELTCDIHTRVFKEWEKFI